MDYFEAKAMLSALDGIARSLDQIANTLKKLTVQTPLVSADERVIGEADCKHASGIDNIVFNPVYMREIGVCKLCQAEVWHNIEKGRWYSIK